MEAIFNQDLILNNDLLLINNLLLMEDMPLNDMPLNDNDYKTPKRQKVIQESLNNIKKKRIVVKCKVLKTVSKKLF
jgi:hypothetical protein